MFIFVSILYSVFCIGVELIYYIVLLSGIQQIQIDICIKPFFMSFSHVGLSQNMESSSLCCKAGPHCLCYLQWCVCVNSNLLVYPPPVSPWVTLSY